MTDQNRRKVLQAVLLAGSVSAAKPTSSNAAGTSSIWPPYVSLTNFGGKPNESKFDNTPALNAALAQQVTNLYVPRGTWHFRTKPNNLTYPLEILGDGFSLSYLVRDYVPKSDQDGLLTIRTKDCRISRLGVGAGHGTAGGAGIALISDTAAMAGFTIIEDVYVSFDHSAPGGTWSNALNVDGSANTSTPIGARDIEIRNCSLFASTNAACRISGGVAVSIRGGGLFLRAARPADCRLQEPMP